MNMRSRIIACLCILSVLVSLFFLAEAVDDIRHEPEYTEFSKGIAATSGVYFMENWNKKGRIYLINSTGDVLGMANTGVLGTDAMSCIEVANDSVYAVSTAVYAGESDGYAVYKISLYDAYLDLVSATAPFVLDEDEEVESIDVIGDSMYISTVGIDGDTANVYELPGDMLTEISGGSRSIGDMEMITEEYLQSLERPLSIIYRESDGAQFFDSAYYNGEDIVILTDADQPTGRFAPDLRVKYAVDRMHFNIAQQISLYSNYVLWWLGGLIIWFILMAVIYMLLRRRNRSLYVFVITELMYLIIVSSAIMFLWRQYGTNAVRSNVRYSILVMRQELDYFPAFNATDYGSIDYYDSQEYREDVLDLRKFATSGYNKAIYYDVFVMDKRTGMIVLDAWGHARESASYVYGSALSTLQDQVRRTNTASYKTFRLGYSDMIAVGMPEKDLSSDYMLVTIGIPDSNENGLWSDGKKVLILFFAVFILGSLLIAFIFYLLSLDLRAFEHAIRDVALGRTMVDVPETPSQDVRSMWNSLSEIGKRMEEINYDKFRIFEAYYRFAPKNVEKLIGKDSIFDVKNGDTASVEGTLMLLTTKDSEARERKIKSVANIMSYMSQFEEEQEGILVSQDSALSVLRFFFLKDFVQTVSRAAQFLHRNASDRESQFVSGFLYSDSFIYGVAGIKSQSLCFITSSHSKEIEDYALWFADMRIPLIITESVARREDAGQTRYIGFIILSSDDRRVDLYEVIDAESARLRQLKLTTRDKFEETLKLFYSKEYYLARNQFSEILKECPEDALARWYLFESERYLNGEADSNARGELRLD